MNPKRERSPTRNRSKSRAATPIQSYYTSSPPSSRSLIVKKWAVRLLIVLIATLAVTIVSDLIKIYISSKTHPQIVDTESDPLIAIQNNRGDYLDPSSRPIILLPPSEIIVLWDLACLQLIPNRYLRLLGCTILPREGQSQKHVLSSKESFPPTALPKDNPERDASIKTPDIASSKSASLESGSFSSKFVTKPTTESVNTLLQTLMATTTVITIDSTVSDTHARTATQHDLPTPAAHAIDDDETHNHSGCIFCGIADNPKEQSRKVYEDERFVAFHDINPSAKVHLLIVPKEHIGSVMNLSYDHIPMLFEMKAMAQ
ncbi:hypothetical protein HDU79_001116 [Rhizoclosmatium sp. JEL0117]|nr:hypothetical protein HDU79_001116 [Rhizoclosmatium sp. JEL0117]